MNNQGSRPWEVVMGWTKSEPSEYSHGDSGKVSDAWTSVKTDDEGNVKDVTVGKAGESKHDHYWDVDKPKSGGTQRVDWGKKK
jgi:hypothetical protein